jgi:hypothetical protein
MEELTERQALERLWRQRVVEAKKRYEFATGLCRGIDSERRPQLAPESEALAEYADALAAFTDLVLRGRRP